VNIYSKSEDELGRLLSNFAHTPFIGNGLVFNSVEGWWYWFVTGKQHWHLPLLYGYTAKREGKKFPRMAEVKPKVLKEVYMAKLAANPRIVQMLLDSGDEPFEHYYVVNGVRKDAPRHLWTAKLWEEIREELRKQL